MWKLPSKCVARLHQKMHYCLPRNMGNMIGISKYSWKIGENTGRH